MAKALYPSDFAPERPARKQPNTPLADTGGTVRTAPVSEDMQRAAAAYLTRTGNGDLLPMLGLCEEGRQPDPTCPTCGAQQGPCRSERDRPLRRWHIARQRIVDTADQP